MPQANDSGAAARARRSFFACRSGLQREEIGDHAVLLVLLRQDANWRIVASWVKDQKVAMDYSRSILARVVDQGRTFFGTPHGRNTQQSLENVEAVAAQLHLHDYLDSVVCGADVQKGKPDPEIYLRAAERLGASPAECVVFEDSPHGVEAAKRGGMKCVAVTNSHPPETLIAADRVVDSLEEIDLVQLIRWI